MFRSGEYWTILFALCGLQTIYSQESCYTPDFRSGQCIPLEQCSYIYEQLSTRSLTFYERDFLRRSQCGYANGKVFICCQGLFNSGSATATTRPRPQVTTPRPRPPVNNQNNINLLPTPPACGPAFSDRIVGGVITGLTEYPWLVLLEYTKPGNQKGFHCGGTLINDRYILTAAHCVTGDGIPKDWRLSGIRLGEWNQTTNPDFVESVNGKRDFADPHVDIEIEERISHPDYVPNSRTQQNDIALLRLRQKVQFSDYIRPVCLPLTNNLRSSLFSNRKADVSGWGQTEREQASLIKLKATLDIADFEQCKNTYKKQNINLQENQMCAGGAEGIDSCRGDSGGPLVIEERINRNNHFFLIGVVSFGPSPCGLLNWPGVYTRVGPYVDWIQSTIRP